MYFPSFLLGWILPEGGGDGVGCGTQQESNNSWQRCEKMETLVHCWRDFKKVQPLWNTGWRFLKKILRKKYTQVWEWGPPYHLQISTACPHRQLKANPWLLIKSLQRMHGLPSQSWRLCGATEGQMTRLLASKRGLVNLLSSLGWLTQDHRDIVFCCSFNLHLIKKKKKKKLPLKQLIYNNYQMLLLIGKFLYVRRWNARFIVVE